MTDTIELVPRTDHEWDIQQVSYFQGRVEKRCKFCLTVKVTRIKGELVWNEWKSGDKPVVSRPKCGG